MLQKHSIVFHGYGVVDSHVTIPVYSETLTLLIVYAELLYIYGSSLDQIVDDICQCYEIMFRVLYVLGG